MKTYVSVGLITLTSAAGALAVAAVAAAAPSGPSQVEDTVRTLQSTGYNVIVNRTGAAPLSNCTVSAVRPGVTHETTDVRGSDIKPLIISETVYVDVTC